MSIENVLLETWRRPEGLLLFYINGPSVIIGRNQNPWREAAPGTGLPLYRRASGGGAVYHDEGNLNWALIVPRLMHSQDAELAMVAAALSAQGVDAGAGTARRPLLRPYFASREQEIVRHGPDASVPGTCSTTGRSSSMPTWPDSTRASAESGPSMTDRCLRYQPRRSTCLPWTRRFRWNPSSKRSPDKSPAFPLGLSPQASPTPCAWRRRRRDLRRTSGFIIATAPFSVLLKGGENAASIRIEKGLVAAISGCGGDGSCLGRPFSYSLLEAMIEQIRSR